MGYLFVYYSEAEPQDFTEEMMMQYLLYLAKTLGCSRVKCRMAVQSEGTGVDYWYFDKEYLKSYNYKQGLILKIYDIEIREIVADSILFRMTLLLNEDIEKGTKQVGSETKDIWISKDKIEGILIES